MIIQQICYNTLRKTDVYLFTPRVYRFVTLNDANSFFQQHLLQVMCTSTWFFYRHKQLFGLVFKMFTPDPGPGHNFINLWYCIGGWMVRILQSIINLVILYKRCVYLLWMANKAVGPIHILFKVVYTLQDAWEVIHNVWTNNKMK